MSRSPHEEPMAQVSPRSFSAPISLARRWGFPLRQLMARNGDGIVLAVPARFSVTASQTAGPDAKDSRRGMHCLACGFSAFWPVPRRAQTPDVCGRAVGRHAPACSGNALASGLGGAEVLGLWRLRYPGLAARCGQRHGGRPVASMEENAIARVLHQHKPADLCLLEHRRG